MKARVTKRGNLAFIETELGQKAVIPWDTLCSFIARYNLDVTVEGGQMPKCVEYTPHSQEEVEIDVEGEDEEDSS
ncbi:hypothetical protein ASAC_1090 [Acidilobus saccharovorans 345-15]|uniref:Uncharacterized protein n=1 Tax=Acidilobus saccharovorans (strain DSM 16705 / JCM 18335 / VKM B-2471 / 345-15) TaxID=666510 RepID=D9Q2F7_ACIS3|nr:hypothetical protein [Acidilobus saccharovorans]ADL19495.1 hypothetical protein ASAC_1090 [Acidilobus saccharovorans 345-15]